MEDGLRADDEETAGNFLGGNAGRIQFPIYVTTTRQRDQVIKLKLRNSLPFLPSLD